jgi:hypothetical protein
MVISGYILIPTPAVRVRQPCGIKGIQVKPPLIRDTIDRYGMGKKIPSVGLNLNILNLVGERPVANWSRYEIPSKP